MCCVPYSAVLVELIISGVGGSLADQKFSSANLCGAA